MNDRRLDDPTAQLLAEMSRYDLDPKTIIWDGRKHRFPGAGGEKPGSRMPPLWRLRGTNAWYFAYPDRRGAHFGDFSSGVKVHWKFHRDTPFSDREKKLFAKQKAERDREQAKKREIALENVKKVWAAAEGLGPETSHPYLYDKGIEEPPSALRISTLTSFTNVSIKTKTEEKIPAGLLLVPMYRSGKLVNLQRIYSRGDKHFFPGADAVGARHTIGLTNDYDWSLCYICEGWATGYAINRLTNLPVIVAFTASNLLAVAKTIRKRFDPGEMRLAADNDRWTKITQGEKGDDLWNVGVQYAREAAEATGSKLVIPDFKDLEGKPTDFHDLLQREGENAARHWLDPENTAQATWQLPLDDPAVAPAEEPKEKKQKTWEDEAPFRPLGHNDGTYYVASEKTGQVRALSEASLGRALAYNSLADRSFWRKWFKGKGPAGFSIPDAGIALTDACMAQGVFREGRYRGRGIWRTEEKGDAVFHWGDRLLAPGATDFSPPERFKDGDRIYPQLERLAGPAMKNPMTLDECLEIHGLFETLAWESEGDAALLAGFIVNAPLSGWLDLRPHVWINGATQSGKSTLVNHIIAAMLKCCGVIHREAHLTTEPAIRQLLKGDALPVILDEADMGRQKSASNLRGLFDLSRSASTGGTVSKGSAKGDSFDFTVRSMFLFCSIVVGLKLVQDKNRVAVLSLKNPRAMDPEKRRKHWAWFQRQMVDRINPQQGRRLLARTVEWVRDGRYEELLKVTTRACYTTMRTARAGDLYGTLVAGSYLMRSDEIPSEDEVVAWLKDAGIGIDLEEGAVRVARGFLELLLQARIPVMQNGVIQRVAVGELIDVVAGRQGDIGVKKDAAHEGLRRRGLWVQGLMDDAELLVANQNEWIKKQTESTLPFEGGWYRVLRALPGAEAGKTTKRFYPGLRSRVTKIPLSSLSE